MATHPGPTKSSVRNAMSPYLFKKEETSLRSPPANCPSHCPDLGYTPYPSSNQWQGMVCLDHLRFHTFVMIRLPSLMGIWRNHGSVSKEEKDGFAIGNQQCMLQSQKTATKNYMATSSGGINRSILLLLPKISRSHFMVSNQGLLFKLHFIEGKNIFLALNSLGFKHIYVF